MSTKFLWGGLTLIMCASILPIPAVEVVGMVVMIIGSVLLILDR